MGLPAVEGKPNAAGKPASRNFLEHLFHKLRGSCCLRVPKNKNKVGIDESTTKGFAAKVESEIVEGASSKKPVVDNQLGQFINRTPKLSTSAVSEANPLDGSLASEGIESPRREDANNEGDSDSSVEM
jgi:hypothetical protein